MNERTCNDALIIIIDPIDIQQLKRI